MQINPYGEEAARLAAALVNVPPAGPGDVVALAREHDLILIRSPGSADVAELRAWAPRLAEVFDARSTPDRIALVNQLLAESTTHPWISDHDGQAPHLHFRQRDLPPARQIAAITTIGLAWFLTFRGMERLRRCTLPECGRAFADTTRNGRQRYCALRCANRDAVRRHRARQR